MSFLDADPRLVTMPTDPVDIGSRAIGFANGIANQMAFPNGTKAPTVPAVVAEGVDEQLRYALRLAGRDSVADDPSQFRAYKDSLAKREPAK
jgi:hypothetical protein